MSGYYGSHRGVVPATADPLDQRRVLVQVPDVTADTSAWAVPEKPTRAAPSIGDGLGIRFDGGDAERPLWWA